ncbi:CBPA [Hepatospora eriocheir]|uniref:CBPA n=1 Tax=Hepatospora eriocheir TaxID=1081669 RepID=A0A1X0Q9J7_9MICR|nr:CBPA [Hepatospora eriocheir]
MICFGITYLISKILADDLEETLNKAREYSKDNKFTEANEYFNKTLQFNNTNKALMYEYYQFLLSYGAYREIIKRHKELNVDSETVNTIESYYRTVKIGDVTKIAKLIKISPNSKDVVYYSIFDALKKSNRTQTDFLIERYFELSQNENMYHFLKGRVLLVDNRFDEARNEFIKANEYEIANIIKNFLRELNYIDEINDSIKFNYLIRLYSKAQPLMGRDLMNPNLYQPLVKKVLIKLIEEAIINKIPDCSCYTTRLLVFEPSNIKFIQYHIQILLNTGKINEAERYLENFKGRFSNQLVKFLSNLILAKKQSEEEDRKKEEEKRRQEQERRKQKQKRLINSNKTNKASTDFKGYYKLLGVEPSADLKEIKKAKKVAVRAFQKKKKKSKGTIDETEMMNINKAYEILSDENKRQMYDNGIDPEDPIARQQGEGPNFEYQNFDFDDFGDMFKMIFNVNERSNRQRIFTQEGGNNNRSYRRVVYYY